MQPRLLAFAALVLCLSVTFAAKTHGGHPIARVIGMIQDLSDKAKEEGEAEAETYEKFEHWCTKSAKNLNKNIAKSREIIEVAQATVDGKSSEEESLMTEIGELETELRVQTKSAQDAAKEREEAQKLFEQSDQELNQTIQATQEAIDSLAAAASLLQVKDNEKAQTLCLGENSRACQRTLALMTMPLVMISLTSEQKDMFLALKSAGSPKTDSGSVVKMLKKLKLEFLDKKAALMQENMKAINEYELAKGARDNAIQIAEDAKKDKERFKGDISSLVTDTKLKLSDAKEDLKADTVTLQDNSVTCKIKADEWKQRTYMRKKEIEAMKFAMDTLERVSGVKAPQALLLSTQAVKSQDAAAPVETPAATALSHVMAALESMRKEGEAHQNSQMKMVARTMELKMGDEPTEKAAEKVDKVFTDELWKLKDEQLADDKKRHWCEIEVSKANASLVEKQEGMAELKAKMVDADATIGELSVDMSNNMKIVNTLNEESHDATLVRQEAQRENHLAVEDAQKAQQAISSAISTLQDYYNEAASAARAAASLLQERKASDAPETWPAGSFTGTAAGGDPGANIIKMLEDLNADFGKMEADTEAMENADQTAYEKIQKDSKVEIARRRTESELKDQERSRLREKLQNFKSSLKLTDRELASVERYLNELNQTCYGGNTTFEERKAERDELIAEYKDDQAHMAKAFKEKIEAEESIIPSMTLAKEKGASSPPAAVALPKTKDGSFLAPIKPASAAVTAANALSAR
eukprot:TRINITY_DN9325_c0_g2_i3.p1 TRINITY_DN9325_c0_g2~~TRINITY_DN9325_c0_g2_i3.p1  ORF type:complete len:756 (+),score=265.68 TRINITY_DN9325_c0_g2_i3:124-2391(+)